MGRISEKANYVADKLKEAGFIVQFYESYSTNSFYLKLDYGMSNSVRISDHSGKKHLKYKFNMITTCVRTCWAKDNNFWRGFYRFDDTDKMIEDIIETKNRKVSNMGQVKYNEVMLKFLKKNKDTKGFWSKAKVI
jgi:hypothetical protein